MKTNKIFSSLLLATLALQTGTTAVSAAETSDASCTSSSSQSSVQESSKEVSKVEDAASSSSVLSQKSSNSSKTVAETPKKSDIKSGVKPADISSTKPSVNVLGLGTTTKAKTNDFTNGLQGNSTDNRLL